MDGDTFDRCEADWHALIERRERQTGAYLAGLAAGTGVYALGVLALLAFLGWTIWTLVPVAPVPGVAVEIALMMGRMMGVFEAGAGIRRWAGESPG